MKHEWLAEELRKIAHGCDVTGIRGSQHIRHAADLLAADVNKLEAENEALREHNAPMIDCLAGKLTSYDQIFGYLCKLEMENEALRAALEFLLPWAEDGAEEGLHHHRNTDEGRRRCKEALLKCNEARAALARAGKHSFMQSPG